MANLLLQVMESGRLTDSEGRWVDFSNVILILTSNIGARESAERHPLGFGSVAEGFEEEVRKRALAEAFRPEFINRLDEVIVFKPLGEGELTEIAERRLSAFAEAAKTHGVTLTFDEDAAGALARLCLCEGTGARPLSRAITKYIEDPLALLLLKKGKGKTLSLRVTLRGGLPWLEAEKDKVPR